MRAAGCLLVVFLSSGHLIGCSDDSGGQNQIDASVDRDGSHPIDRGVDLQPPPDQKSAPDDPSLLNAIIDKVILPTKGEDFAVDLDGSGPKNQLGNILGAIMLFADLQQQMDAEMDAGDVLILFDIHAKSLVDDPDIKVQMYLGEDQDADPSDNFSGNEPFGVHSDTPEDLIFTGSITSGKMEAGPGVVPIPFNFGAPGTVIVFLQESRVVADVSSSNPAMTNGQLNGAIPKDDLKKKILPIIAGVFTDMLKNSPDPTIKNLMSDMDEAGNENGVIDPDEVENSQIFGKFFEPDVDLDGDEIPDGLSIGMGFTATTCVIDT